VSLTLGIALYFIIWWVMLFAVLPFGVHTQADDGGVVRGTPESAPAKFGMARVAMITTVVAALVWAAVWVALRYKLIPLDLGGPS
jgi:predicted secreted protein